MKRKRDDTAVDQNVDNNESNLSNSLALHQAIRDNNESLVNDLLQNVANISEIDALGNTALHVACSKYECVRPATIKLLIEHSDINIINMQNNKGKTPLLLLLGYASQHDEPKELEALILAMLEKGADSNIPSNDDMSAFRFVFYLRFKFSTLEMFVNHANLDTINRIHGDNTTALSEFIFHGLSEDGWSQELDNGVEILLKKGANPNSIVNYCDTQTTVLHLVCEKFVVFSTIFLLLRYGADSRKVSDDDNAFSVTDTFNSSEGKLEGHEYVMQLLKNMESVQHVLGKRKSDTDNRKDLFALQEFNTLLEQIARVEYADSIDDFTQLSQFFEVKKNNSNTFFGASLPADTEFRDNSDNKIPFMLARVIPK